MNDKCIWELAKWLSNNTDLGCGKPLIFSGEEQQRLEKILVEEFMGGQDFGDPSEAPMPSKELLDYIESLTRGE